MVEFLFTEDNNSVDSEEQSSENFCDISTINMLNKVTSRSLKFLPYKKICVFCGFFLKLKLPGKDCATLLKTNIFKDIFQGF